MQPLLNIIHIVRYYGLVSYAVSLDPSQDDGSTYIPTFIQAAIMDVEIKRQRFFIFGEIQRQAQSIAMDREQVASVQSEIYVSPASTPGNGTYAGRHDQILPSSDVGTVTLRNRFQASFDSASNAESV